MNRRKAKQFIDNAQKTLEQKRKTGKIVITPSTWNRVKTSQQYEQEDIIAVASCLLNTHGYDFQQQLKVLCGEGQLKVWLESIKQFDVHQNAYFCVYSSQENHWVVFCILKWNSEIVVLYNDPCGGDILPEIQKAITDRYSKIELLFKSHSANNENTSDLCTPMSLKNLEIILEGLNEKKCKFIKEFTSIEFCSSHEVPNIREKFQAKLLHCVNDNILLSIDELSKEKDFIKSMNLFIEQCTEYVGVKDLVFKYCDALKGEVEKIDKDSNYCMNETKIKEVKMNLFENEYFQEQIKSFSGESLNKFNTTIDQIESKNKIKDEFPEQLDTFVNLFSWIMNYKGTEERDNFLRKISEVMDLEFKKVQKFFEIQNLRESSNVQQDSETSGSEELRSAEDMEKDFPPFVDPSDICATSVKTTEQLLQELCLDDTWSFKNGEKMDRGGRVPALGHCLSRVHQARDRRWREASAREIRLWATHRRAQSSREGVEREGTSDEDVIETLAVICRAHSLVTGGQQLRDNQLLAALVCLLGKKGNLCQMATGEGKTAVISMLAAADVLLHDRQVDILTSNHVLAYEGFTSRRCFYQLLGITVSCSSPKHRRHTGESGPRHCYNADVVYGDLATFQFDFLHHYFQLMGTLGDRSFGRVIVDEVDSMLIDNAVCIAKLAHNFPGMDSLRYVLIKIWQATYKAADDIADLIDRKLRDKAEEIGKEAKIFEQQLIKEFSDSMSSKGMAKEQLKAKGDNLRVKRDDFKKHSQMEYEKYRRKLCKDEIDNIKERIKKLNPSQIDIIPAHLRDYASRMEDRWIDNALYAMYECFENEQYVLRIDEESNETVVIPVDYKNTGITQKNTVWSYGVHQFIQLKHNLRVTTESLTSCFISNVSFIKRYGNNIWGLTGTMGSDAETLLLLNTYEVSYAKIPTYKLKAVIELDGIVVANSEWANVVALDAFLYAFSKRSVLIICKTISDVLLIEMNIKALLRIHKVKNITIKTYIDEDSSEIVKEVVGPCEIIIATNIAGRGTDLRTSKFLEENGGLHVCVAFLPSNQRVGDQAKGRTGRQGNRGSVQIILCHNDVLELGTNISPDMNFRTIMKKRDNLEKARISKLQEEDLEDIQFLDAIFIHFLKIYTNLQKKAEKNASILYLTMDLKEIWAFWLHEKDFKKNRSTRKTVDEEFQDFLTKANKILGVKKNGTFNGGEIAFNPYYGIQQAEYFLSLGSIQESEKVLLHVINLDPENSHILHAAYFKLFEVEMEKGQQLFERFKKAMLDTVNISIIGPTYQKNETYKERSVNALEKAKQALEKEINYMRINFMGNNADGTSFNKSANNQDFINILISNNNPLVKQVLSRYTVLSTFYQHVLGLIQQIRKSLQNDDGSTSGLAVITRDSNYLKQNSLKKSNSQTILLADLSEIGELGLETMYALREIHDVPKEVISRAQGQIMAGLAAAATGAIFPPALIVTGPLASTLISEGICDIVLEVINQGYGEFSEEAYIKGKIISYAISFITLGVSALSQCVTLLDEAIKCCKSLASILNKCPYMQSVCKKLASMVDRLGTYFQKLKYMAQMSKLSKTALAASRMQLFGSVIMNTGKSTIKSLVGSVITEKIVNAQLKEMLRIIEPDIVKMVEKTVKARVTEDDLSEINKTELKALTKNILSTYEMSDILIEVALGLLRHSGSWYAKTASLAVNTVLFTQKIYKYSENFCEKLKIGLANTHKSGRKNEESCEELQIIIIKALSDKIYNLLIQIVGKYSNTLVINPMMNEVWNFVDSSERRNKQTEEQRNKKFYEIVEAFELLGLDYGASNQEINRAWRLHSKECHPDSSSKDWSRSGEENTEQFICFTEARNLLLDLNKQVASYEVLSSSKGPAHRGNIETLSKEDKRHIVISISETGETEEFGQEYRDNGKSSINLLYESPSENGCGHYRVLESDKIEVQASGDYNCFYNAYAAVCKSEGINMTPEHARWTAEKISWPNLYYGSINSVSEVFNNDVTKMMYLQSKTSLLVGGDDSNSNENTDKAENPTPDDDRNKSFWDYMEDDPSLYLPFITD